MSAGAQAATTGWTTTGLRWPGYLLGFGLGGFFDGILLHQILQWHHLLSLVEGVGDLRSQMIFDGLFHALMYVIALVGAVMLIRRRAALVQAASGRALFAAVLIGFGAWHVIDAVLSHWLLGIHRIKLDSPNPLAWDLIWLAAFGVLPLVAGWRLLRRRQQKASTAGNAHRSLLVAGLVATGMAAASLTPPPEQEFTTVVFAPGTRPATVMNAIVASESRLVWSDPAMSVIVVDSPAKWEWYRRGALLVSGAALPSGCFNWSKGIA